MIQGNPDFRPANFKGGGDVLGTLVWQHQLPITAGCIIGALPAGEMIAPYLRVVSLVEGTKNTVVPGVGDVPVGILVPNPARMKNDPPVMQQGYFAGEPATLMRFGQFQITKWALLAGLGAPSIGGKVVALDTTGELGFVDYNDGVPSGCTQVKAVVVAVGEPNGATVFLGLDSLVMAANKGMDVPVAATPVAAPAAGKVAVDTPVVLTTATAGAQIYYTLDGTEPSLATAALYSAPVVVDAAVTIKAVAVKDGMTTSAVLTAAYTV
jgi:hypothetical protein